MQRRFSIAALTLVPLLLAGCEQKPASSPTASPKAVQASGGEHAVRFELVGPAPVGALQFDVAYEGGGRFVGDADAVACETKLDGALSSYNHLPDQNLLRAAFVAVAGFSGPVTICECRFQGAAKASDFQVKVRDASSPELEEMDPPPTVQAVVD